MNIDIYKFSDLFIIKVKILGIKYLVFRKRKSGSDNAPILNMTRKTEKKMKPLELITENQTTNYIL